MGIQFTTIEDHGEIEADDGLAKLSAEDAEVQIHRGSGKPLGQTRSLKREVQNRCTRKNCMPDCAS